jgi:ribosome maturation factor RimP
MIKAETIRMLIEKDLRERDFFLVDIQVKSSGKIFVYADTLGGITLDECVTISRLIEKKMDRNVEDYELEVSSPGLDNPLRLPFQYRKNTGRMVRIVKTDGAVNEGKIREADDEKVKLEVTLKKKRAGKKEEIKTELVEMYYSDIKTAKLLIR